MFEFNSFIVAGKFFLVIAGELILIFIVVAFIIGLLMEYLPPSSVRNFLVGKLMFLQYFLGAGLGAITPFCSCSTVPLVTGLLKGGVPFGPVMAFLFSSPVLNPVIIGLFLMLLGFKVTAVYVAVTFFGSMLMAAILSKIGLEKDVKSLASIQRGCCDEPSVPDPVAIKTEPVAGNCCCSVDDKARVEASVQSACCSASLAAADSGGVSFKERIKRASVAALVTFKGVFWYLMLGAGIGAFIYGFFPQDLVVRLAGTGNPWSIPIAAALGVPMYIRTETVIPIGAALVAKGMGVGTVIALIIGGAGASIPEIIILGAVFKKRLIFAFVLTVFTVAVVAGYLIDVLCIMP
ncbi:MAG: permease [Kiritimatiellia bacterium]